MSSVLEGQELRLTNVLSLRKKLLQTDIQQELMSIGKYIQENNLKKNGPLITTTFSIEQSASMPLLDMEILVPLNQEVNLPSPYVFKKVFHIKNALYARHQGNPQLLQNSLLRVLFLFFGYSIT